MALLQISRKIVYDGEGSSKLHHASSSIIVMGAYHFSCRSQRSMPALTFLDYSFEATAYDRGLTYSYPIDIILGHMYEGTDDLPKTVFAPIVDQS